MKISDKQCETFISLSEYMPELLTKGIPKDREFFFNVLNTIHKNCIDQIVYNSIKGR